MELTRLEKYASLNIFHCRKEKPYPNNQFNPPPKAKGAEVPL